MDEPEPPMPMGDGDPMNAPEPPMPEGGPDMDEPMDSPEPPTPDDDGNEDNSEINDIFDKLDTEKQAAVIKYAKSMVNGTEEDDDDTPEPPMPEGGPDMPMESKRGLNNLISEIVNNILSDMETGEEEDRRDDKIRNKKVTKDNPYISKR